MEESYAGIDWASEEHALCVVDAAGTVSAQRSESAFAGSAWR